MCFHSVTALAALEHKTTAASIKIFNLQVQQMNESTELLL